MIGVAVSESLIQCCRPMKAAGASWRFLAFAAASWEPPVSLQQAEIFSAGLCVLCCHSPEAESGLRTPTPNYILGTEFWVK